MTEVRVWGTGAGSGQWAMFAMAPPSCASVLPAPPPLRAVSAERHAADVQIANRDRYRAARSLYCCLHGCFHRTIYALDTRSEREPQGTGPTIHPISKQRVASPTKNIQTILTSSFSLAGSLYDLLFNFPFIFYFLLLNF